MCGENDVSFLLLDEEDNEGMSSRRPRAVPLNEATACCQQRGYLHWEVSSKTGNNVNDMFEAVLDAVAKKIIPSL